MLSNLIQYLPDLLSGTLLTILLTLLSILFGALIALFFTITIEINQYLAAPIRLFIIFICGTPLLVQLFLIYFGLGQFAFIQNSFLWLFFREPIACAVLALSINTAAYTTNLLRGAIASVPRNEISACYALGMSKWQSLRRIILPRAMRMIIPAYSNEIIIILKSTSLASTITLLDLMGVTQSLIAKTYNTITFYVIAGVIYLCLNYLLLFLYRAFTKNYKFKH